jgi:alpha-tubulin suppressor-like RCC1 family protein
MSCWGLNTAGQLGVGDRAVHRTPTAVAGNDWVEVDPFGEDHACGLRAGGQVWCWGAGHDGILGTGNETDAIVPVPVL